MANTPGSGGGTPPGYDPFNQAIPVDQRRDTVDNRLGDVGRIRADDPGFQNPADPLQDAKGRTRLVYRDIPIISLAENWLPAGIESALRSHVIGLFDASGQLADQLIADPRVTATLNSRLAGLFGREVRFRPANKSRAAKEVCDAWVEAWPMLCSGGSLQQISAYQILFGWWPAQILWNQTTSIKRPILAPWHARYTYYHWDLRKYIALTQDGQMAIYPGDSKWVLHAPRGEYRAWMWGAVRAVAWPWLLRKFAQRDMSRFSEVHGMPTRVGIAPAAADPKERDLFAQQLSTLGAETTLLLAVGVDKSGQSYDYKLVEATSTGWQIFPGLIDRCDMDIVLAIMMQNLTTEVTGGSFAATQSHMDMRQAGIENDNESWRLTLHDQVARPFAYLNFGDPDLAPWTDWDVTPRQNYSDNGKNFLSFGQAIQIARQGGMEFTDEDDLRKFALSNFGITLPNSIRMTEPNSGAGKKEEKPESSTKPPMKESK